MNASLITGMTRKILKCCMLIKGAAYPTFYKGHFLQNKDMLLNPDVAKVGFPKVYFFFPVNTDTQLFIRDFSYKIKTCF